MKNNLIMMTKLLAAKLMVLLLCSACGDAINPKNNTNTIQQLGGSEAGNPNKPKGGSEAGNPSHPEGENDTYSKLLGSVALIEGSGCAEIVSVQAKGSQDNLFQGNVDKECHFQFDVKAGDSYEIGLLSVTQELFPAILSESDSNTVTVAEDAVEVNVGTLFFKMPTPEQLGFMKETLKRDKSITKKDNLIKSLE